MTAGRRLAVAGLVAVELAFHPSCGGQSTTSPSSPGGTTLRGPNFNGRLDVAVVVDPDAIEYSEPDLRRVLAVAGDKLRDLTGETLGVTEVNLADQHGATAATLAASYAAALNPLRQTLPEAIVVATHDSTAHNFGGYSVSQTAPASWAFVNEYSPASASSSRLYIAAVEFTHPYARCGYDDALNRVSDVSLGGECFNVPGLACVQHDRRWVCPTALDDPYMSADYFAACTVVHEIIHPFGPAGNYDHYGTQTCRDRTGMSASTAADRKAAEIYCGMCPDVYGQFRKR